MTLSIVRHRLQGGNAIKLEFGFFQLCLLLFTIATAFLFFWESNRATWGVSLPAVAGIIMAAGGIFAFLYFWLAVFTWRTELNKALVVEENSLSA